MSLLLRDVRLGPAGPQVDVEVENGCIQGIEAASRSVRAGRAYLLEGQDLTVLPGLVDAHVHLTQWAQARRRVDVSGCHSPEAVVQTIRRHVTDRTTTGRRPDELVTAYGFRDSDWTSHPHASLLERALPGMAILVISNDLHTAWVSPAAAALAGGCLPESGVVRERAALDLMRRLPATSVDELDSMVSQALEAAATRGVTGVLDFEVADNVADWTRRSRRGDAPFPVGVVTTVYPEFLDAVISAGLREGDSLPGCRNDVKIGPLKVFVDGSLNTGTALCHEPYIGGEPEHRGDLTTSPLELEELMHRAWRSGIGSAIHAIGDRAVQIALDGFERVACRGRIEHAQLMRPDDIDRMARLPVVAGIQPVHGLDDRAVTERVWADRVRYAFPHGSLVHAGVPVEIGSDAPVSPLDPWLGIAAAVHRTINDEPPWQPAQRMPLAAALAAAAGGRTQIRGGDSADLVVIEGDPAQMSGAELAKVRVVGTFRQGKATHIEV